MGAVAACFFAELRTTFRSSLHWLVAVAVVVVSLLVSLACGELYVRGAAYFPATDVLTPGMMISTHRTAVLAFLLVAQTFLLVNFGVRDEKEGIAAVLNAKPMTNFAHVAGRLTGSLAAAWWPVAFSAALWLALAYLGSQVAVGFPVEVAPFAAFLFLDLIPAQLLWGAMLVLLIGALRSRLWAVAVATPLLVASLWFMSWIPRHFAPAWSDVQVFLHRGALLVVGVGIVTFAATIHPRLDNRSPATRAIGIALLCAGLLVLGTMAKAAANDLELRGQWLAAHAAEDGAMANIDLEHVGGRVFIEPGERLRVEVDLVLRRSAEAFPSPLVLSLNPGMAVERLTLAGLEAPHSHAMGLLKVELPRSLRHAETVVLSAAAVGVPDPAFAYLDAAVDWRTSESGSALAYLGTEATLFDADHVALMPAAAWLPLVGANVRRDEAPKDFHAVDLIVEVPSGWRVAGPGGRIADGEDGIVFRPTAPVEQVALIASRFERRAIDVDGVAVELLFAGEHAPTLERMADLEPFVAARLSSIFSDADRMGLSYPYDGLSFVEVPRRLRVYGGGWRLGSVQALPGVVLVREPHFRLQQFASAFLPYEDNPEEKFHLLETYFRLDTMGGNPYVGLARNLLQTSARGDGAREIDFLLETVMNHLLAKSAADFSAHDFGDAARLAELISSSYLSTIALAVGLGDASVALPPESSSVWDRALEAPLSELDPTDDPRQALGVLRLKCRALATLLFDLIGTTRTALAVAELRERFTGTTFTKEALAEVLGNFEADADIGDYLDGWLYDAALPGFLVSEIEVYPLPLDDQRRPQYQIRFHVRNDEPVAGYVRFSYGWSRGSITGSNESDPIHVGGQSSVEVGLVGRIIDVDHLFVRPYLALNRAPVYTNDVRKRSPGNIEPLNFVRPSTWKPDELADLVVDDLDAGFAVIEPATDVADAHGGLAERDLRPRDIALDLWRRELPWGWRVFVNGAVAFRALDLAGERHERRWMRQEVSSAWGRYRHTVARTLSGDGDRRAAFTTSLPFAGRWRLDYHLPALSMQVPGVPVGVASVVQMSLHSTSQGSYDMTLVVGESRTPIAFNAALAPPGWNKVGEFDLTAGSVALEVSNRTGGESAIAGSTIVIADAIRWRPVDGRLAP